MIRLKEGTPSKLKVLMHFFPPDIILTVRYCVFLPESSLTSYVLNAHLFSRLNSLFEVSLAATALTLITLLDFAILYYRPFACKKKTEIATNNVDSLYRLAILSITCVVMKKNLTIHCT